MPLTQEQAFKYGFLLYCAERGLTRDETHQLVKQAQVNMTKQALLPALSALLGGGLTAGKAIADTGMKGLSMLPGALSGLGTAAVVAPIAAGAGSGYLAAKMTDGASSASLDEVKQDEILDEYERLTEEAKRRALIKRIQAQTGRHIVPLSPSLGV